MDQTTPPIQPAPNNNESASQSKSNSRLFYIVSAGVALIILVIGLVFWINREPASYIDNFLKKFLGKGGQTVCTMEAKQCADGSYVSRTGPNCEFTACPAASDCVKENESIGAVYPGVVPKQCCAGLTPVIPQNIVGTQGICKKIEEATKDWKTYINENYGFEFQYPKDHTVYTTIDEAKSLLIPADAQSNNVKIAEDEKLLFGAEANILEFKFIPEKISAGDWLEKNKATLFSKEATVTVKNFELGGKSALEVNGAGTIDSLYGVVIIEENNGLLIITQGVSSNLFNNILATFKFVSPGPQSCQTDSDCACGTKIDTGGCFYGNKQYVDTKKQCPDFCSGIDGKMVTRCVKNVCAQFKIANNQALCTTDTKECPDGSWVNRVAPNCQFAPCPKMDQ